MNLSPKVPLKSSKYSHIISVTTDIGGMEVSDYGWDDEKAKYNKEKHGVTFREATEIFDNYDRFLYFGEDTTEDYRERRFTAAGFTKKRRFLYVVYEESEDDIGEIRHIIHAKEFERSHVKHFRDPNDKRDLKALLECR